MKIVCVPIEKVRPWKKNPRGISEDDFARLKKQIKELGFYKPLVAVEEGDHFVVLGGNMRLRALKELGFKVIDLSIVKASNDARRLEFNLSDNDRAGHYEDAALQELLHDNQDDIDLEGYKVDLGYAISLKSLLASVSPPPGGGGAGEAGDDEEKFIEIYCSEDRLAEIRPTLTKWRKLDGVRIKIS